MTNNKNVLKVLNGYISLSNDEKSIFVDEINKYIKSSYNERSILNEQIEKSVRLDLGPTSDGVCPCCGKS